MTGILNLTTTGLILAETWETDLTAWTSTRVGSTTAAAALSSEAAHSGSKSVDFQTGADWPDAAYLKLTRTVDLKTGANRKVRFFRGLNVKGAAYDDFLGSSIKSDRWGGSNGGVANSLVKIADSASAYDLYTIIVTDPLGSLLRLAAKLKVGPSTNGSGRNNWYPFSYQHSRNNPQINWGDDYGLNYDNHYIDAGNQLIATDAYPDTNMHVYEMEWYDGSYPNNYLKFWKDGSLKGSRYGDYCPWETNHFAEFYGNPGYKTDFYVDWLASSYPNAYKCSLKLGTQTLFDNSADADYGGALPVENNFFDECNGWAAVTDTGSQTVEIKMRNASGYKQQFPVHMFFDDLAIMLDTNMTIKSLQGGQKVELYDSGGSLRKSGTCPLTGVDVVFTGIDAMIDTAYGFQGYFKVYDTDGVTLLYTSATTSRWGGDIYTWLPNESKCDISTNRTIVYKS